MSTLPPVKPPLLDVGSLDERILQVEQRLIAREEALGRDLNGFVRRLRHDLQPRRLIKLTLGAGLLTLVAGWWLGRSSAPRYRVAGAVAEPWWAKILPLVLPLLPQIWRERAGPVAAAFAVAPGLLAREEGPPPRTMPEVDLARYAGTWFEIARLPAPFEGACEGQPTATYVPRGDTIDVINRCEGKDGRVREARGQAQVVPGSGGGRLKVSLVPRWMRWLPGGWADYWILHLDPGYTMALVGSPNRKYLWILARQRCLAPHDLEALVDIARAEGFAVDQLHVVQPGGVINDERS